MQDFHFQQIMIVKLRALGDILTTFPLIRALQERFPKAQLHMLADEQYQDLFTGHPRLHRFWPHPAQRLRHQNAWQSLQHQTQVSRALRQAGIDCYIDLYGSMRTALWGALARIPVRMGFNLRGRKYFYNQRIVAAHRYVVDINLQFASSLGWEGQDNRLEFFLQPADQQAAQVRLTEQGLAPGSAYIVISPGGGWSLKCWSPEKFGAVGRALVEKTGCRIVLSGTAAEKPLLEICARQLPAPPIMACGWPLRHLAAMIQKARLLLGNDSGPKYFAEAFGVPTLICYGPTDYENNNPVSSRHRVAVRELACRPCHSEICRAPSRACLDDLSVSEVLALAWPLLEQDQH